MIIDCISDIHGSYPKLEGGDLLIICGDLTARDSVEEHLQFADWLDIQSYTYKVVIAGNHDNNIDPESIECLRGAYYLQDSGCTIENLNLWGSPWTKTFKGMNPHCKAFTVDTEEEMKEKFDLIRKDTDILITHCPPYGMFNAIPMKDGTDLHLGSQSLLEVIVRIEPLICVFGHIHEAYGRESAFYPSGKVGTVVNASIFYSNKDDDNKPIRVIL
jgi:Icc-related predicted phosphoesterase